MNSNGFAHWLEQLQARLNWSDTKLASEIGVSASTMSLWKHKGVMPSKTQQLDRLVDISGENKSVVYMLAGRGFVGMDVQGIDRKYLELAAAMQANEDSITNQAVKRAYFDLMKMKILEAANVLEWESELREKLHGDRT